MDEDTPSLPQRVFGWIAAWSSVARNIFFPYLPRKDAGYIANLLAEYDTFAYDERQRLPNFDVVDAAVAILRRGNGGRTAARDDPVNTPSADLPGGGAVTGRLQPNEAPRWLLNYMRDIFVVENAILRLQSLPELVARAPFLLERFRRVADNAATLVKHKYEQDLSDESLAKIRQQWEVSQGAPDDAAKQQEELLRSRLTALLNDIHWWYAQSQVREELFLSHQLWLFVALLIVTAIMSIVFRNCGAYDIQVALGTMYMGCLGAFTSILRRMRQGNSARDDGESSFKELTALAYGKIGVVAGVFFGGVFAYVLLLLFQSGIAATVVNPELAVKVFPQFPVEDDKFAKCWMCVVTVAGSATELSKLLVWSFLAGFAEQLVPDVLDRVARTASDKK